MWRLQLIDDGYLLLRTLHDTLSSEQPRAVWIEGLRRVQIKREQQEEIALSSGNVRIRTMYSGISAGTEMLVYRGQVPKGMTLGLNASSTEELIDYPIKYGYCNVGRVEKTGENCKRLEIGDVVFTFHPHETEFVAPEESCIDIPSDIPPINGVFIANVETAIGIVHDANLRLGENVTVIGLGIIGLLVSLLSQRSGSSVVALEKLKNRLELARSFGIPSFDNTKQIFSPDVVIETSGNPDALQEAINMSGPETRIVVGSWYGSKEVRLDLGQKFHRNRNQIISSQVSRINPALQGRWTKERRLLLAVDLLKQLPLSKLITDVFPFVDAARAYEKIDKHPESTLQVVLDYTEHA